MKQQVRRSAAPKDWETLPYRAAYNAAPEVRSLSQAHSTLLHASVNTALYHDVMLHVIHAAFQRHAAPNCFLSLQRIYLMYLLTRHCIQDWRVWANGRRESEEKARRESEEKARRAAESAAYDEWDAMAEEMDAVSDAAQAAITAGSGQPAALYSTGFRLTGNP